MKRFSRAVKTYGAMSAMALLAVASHADSGSKAVSAQMRIEAGKHSLADVRNVRITRLSDTARAVWMVELDERILVLSAISTTVDPCESRRIEAITPRFGQVAKRAALLLRLHDHSTRVCKDRVGADWEAELTHLREGRIVGRMLVSGWPAPTEISFLNSPK